MVGNSIEFAGGGAPQQADGRLDSSAFHRNHRPIWSVLQRFLAGKSGDVLEAGSGSGQHIVFFAGQCPELTWWPSDVSPDHLRSIDAWRAHAGVRNVQPALRIDLPAREWFGPGQGPQDLVAIVCANVIHIAPWRVAEGLFAGAGRYLRSDGRLFLYGPFKRDGEHTAPSNAAFDAGLRQTNPEWGVRDIGELVALAQRCGLVLREIVDMPANNMILAFERLLIEPSA